MPNLTAETFLAFIAGLAVAWLYTKLVERSVRTPADDSNVTSVREDEAAPLRRLFTEREEQQLALPPRVVPAKRGPGRPRKHEAVISGGTALGPSTAAPTKRRKYTH
jgi:hypothetical protein